MRIMSQTDQNVKQQTRPEQTAKHEVIIEQATKPEIRSEPTQDFFVTYKQNVERYFENMENSIPKYYQTLLENLTGSGLINRIEYDGKNTFVITPKGKQYLESYVRFSNVAGAFGLEL